MERDQSVAHKRDFFSLSPSAWGTGLKLNNLISPHRARQQKANKGLLFLLQLSRHFVIFKILTSNSWKIAPISHLLKESRVLSGG